MSSSTPISLATAMRRGLFHKCPACGEGSLFVKFLKSAPACSACGEEMHHHRADDLPAYLTVCIVGHLIVPIILAWEVRSSPAIWLQLSIWLPVTALSCLALLQPIKGAIIGLQWHKGLHGFGDAKALRDKALRDHAQSEAAVLSPSAS